MGNETTDLVQYLNHPDVRVRLNSLKELMVQVNQGIIPCPVTGNDVNNHIHTTYSFSPYSPAMAVWKAYTAGLQTAGIMDHDSISGAEEFIEAGKIVGMATTIGVECRADFSQTPLAGRRINNPDQISIAYMALHGIPHTQIQKVKDFFKPYMQKRNERNMQMVERLNTLFAPYGIRLDFDTDVLPLSLCHEGGSITERHILFALSHKLISLFTKGSQLVDFLSNTLRMQLPAKIQDLLQDENNPYYAYDLLGVLKSELVGQFYIDAVEECPDVRTVLALARDTGAISAYAYLGDVGNSVTGDKKTQKFEDDYIELLFDVLGELGFNAITYMPSRNSIQQLQRVMEMCREKGFFQISGEDINTPRQSFVCAAQRGEEFKHLIDATWALIGHEKAATHELSRAMFSEDTVQKYSDIQERIIKYKEIGKGQI